MKYIHNKGVIVTQKSKTIAHAAVTAMAAVLFAMSAIGLTSAKEITSGGGAGVGTTVCNPVKSLSYKGDARVGELGFASIDINYSVSPCDKTVPVRVVVSLTQNVAGAEPVYLDENAPLSGKFTVNGVLVGKSYIAKVQVYNAQSGELLKSSQIFAAAVRKTGV
jgi:hypothetical protein